MNSERWCCDGGGAVFGRSGLLAKDAMYASVRVGENAGVNLRTAVSCEGKSERRETCSECKRDWHVTSRRQAKIVERDEPQ